MANNFKKQVQQQRAAIPQLDPEQGREVAPAPLPPAVESQPQLPQSVEKPAVVPETDPAPFPLTTVDTTEAPVNRGFSMYPSRHRQVAHDLAYLEDRKPWQIIEDALEEYVVKHYGKTYRRK